MKTQTPGPIRFLYLFYAICLALTLGLGAWAILYFLILPLAPQLPVSWQIQALFTTLLTAFFLQFYARLAWPLFVGTDTKEDALRYRTFCCFYFSILLLQRMPPPGLLLLCWLIAGLWFFRVPLQNMFGNNPTPWIIITLIIFFLPYLVGYWVERLIRQDLSTKIGIKLRL